MYSFHVKLYLSMPNDIINFLISRNAENNVQEEMCNMYVYRNTSHN